MVARNLSPPPQPPSEELNGLAKKGSRLSNGNAAITARRRLSVVKTSSWRSWLFNTAARLFTWYAIITVLFRCPSTLEECDETSPVICKAYFHTKAAIIPHVEPYFDEYAAPYVEIVNPYFQAVSNSVITPTRAIVERYGAPKAQQAKEYLQAHWATTGQPQVDKVRDLTNEQYQRNVAPYLDQISQSLAPYYDVTRTSALRTYDELLLPSYEFVKPYALIAYDAAQTVTTETIIPSAVWTFNKTYTLLDDHVWPHVKGLYVENVEPQLVRIGQRLGRYRDAPSTGIPKKSVPPSPDTKSSSFVVKPSESTPPHASSSVASAKTTSVSSVPAPESSAGASSKASPEIQPEADVEDDAKPKKVEKPSQDEARRIAAETVAEDLHQWQTKFANAADEGAAEIEDSVHEISESMIKSHVRGQGDRLVTELKEAAEEEIAKLHKNIISLVQSSGKVTRGETEESAFAAVRQAGLIVKEKAEKIRSWREDFEAELHTAVTAAAQEHFNILGNMRDLALQKIGMKWAWMDGVTYKDWAKYHDMKKRFDEWTDELQQLIVTHPALEAAMNEAAYVEDDGMEAAQNAAKELARLKQVAAWKIEAGDASDNFDSDDMRRAAEAADANPDTIPSHVIDTPSADHPDTDAELGTAPEDAPEPVPEADVEDEPEGTANSPRDAQSDAAADPLPAEEDFETAEQGDAKLPPLDKFEPADVPIKAEAHPIVEQESNAEAIVPEPAEEDQNVVEQAEADAVPTADPEDTFVAEEAEEDSPAATVVPPVEEVPLVQPIVPGAAAASVEGNSEPILDETEETEEEIDQASIVSKVSASVSESVAAEHSGVTAGLEEQGEETTPVADDKPEEPMPEKTDEKDADNLLWSNNAEATHATKDEL